MTLIRILVAQETLVARWEDELAPRSCAALRSLVPLSGTLLHVRWSGEACWVPMGELDLGVGAENATSTPRPGQILLYPGGISETEILIPYGIVRFSSKAGALAGNPVLTVVEGLERLASLGSLVLTRGALDIIFR